MSLNGVLAAISDHPEYRRHLELMANSLEAPEVTVRQGGCPGYIGALWRRQLGPILVVAPRPEDARRLHDQLLTYLGDAQPVYLAPEPEVLPFERLAVDAYTSHQRLAALAALSDPSGCRNGASGSRDGKGSAYPLVVTSIGAALHKTLPLEIMTGPGGSTGDGKLGSYRIRVGERVRLNRLLTQWVDLGYRNEPLVEAPGCFSHRGGIIDLYPPHSALPFRIELWDDEVDTIRLFDPYSQRSVRSADEVRFIPAREQLPSLADHAMVEQLTAAMDFTKCTVEVRERVEDELAHLLSAPNIESLTFYNGLLNHTSLLEYLPEHGRVVLDRASQIEAEALELEERFGRMRASREERGELPGHFPSPYIAWEEFAAKLAQKRRLLLQSWVSADEDHIFQPAVPYYGRLEQLASDARRYQQQGTAVVAVTQHARRLAEILEESGAGVTVSETLEAAPQPGRIYLIPGSLREGWTLAPQSTPLVAEMPPSPAYTGGNCSLTLLTDAELFGTVKERRYRRNSRVEHGPEVALADLVPGSFVVHIDHGVARFAGTTKIGDNGAERSTWSWSTPSKTSFTCPPTTWTGSPLTSAPWTTRPP